MPIDEKARQWVTEQNEKVAEKQLSRVLGYRITRLDIPGREGRKRVDGVLVRPEDPLDPAQLEPDTRATMIGEMLGLSDVQRQMLRLVFDSGGLLYIEERRYPDWADVARALVDDRFLERTGSSG